MNDLTLVLLLIIIFAALTFPLLFIAVSGRKGSRTMSKGRPAPGPTRERKAESEKVFSTEEGEEMMNTARHMIGNDPARGAHIVRKWLNNK